MNSLIDKNGYLLWLASTKWQRLLKQNLIDYNLTHTQYFVLNSIFNLTQNTDAITQAEIIKYTNLDKMLVSNIIKNLEERNYITRRVYKIDVRQNKIRMSKIGKQLYPKIEKKIQLFEADFFNLLITKKDILQTQLEKLLV